MDVRMHWHPYIYIHKSAYIDVRYTGVRIYGGPYIRTPVYTDVRVYGRTYMRASIYTDVSIYGRPYIYIYICTSVQELKKLP